MERISDVSIKVTNLIKTECELVLVSTSIKDCSYLNILWNLINFLGGYLINIKHLNHLKNV